MIKKRILAILLVLLVFLLAGCIKSTISVNGIRTVRYRANHHGPVQTIPGYGGAGYGVKDMFSEASTVPAGLRLPIIQTINT